MKVAVITLVLFFAIGPTFSQAQSVETAVKAAFEPEFVHIPAGRFRMGSDIGMVDESPAHTVVIEREFWLQATEVTQAEWESVMGVNPSSNPGCGRCPVETVSWDEVKQFIAKLNERDEEFEYRLPSEAEWEYAARAGTVADALPTLDSEAWYFTGRSVGGAQPVGSKSPNRWGLYDILGNVWEWVEDRYGRYGGPPKDERLRVFRGGCWATAADILRPAYRGAAYQSDRLTLVGFRVVRSAKRLS